MNPSDRLNLDSFHVDASACLELLRKRHFVGAMKLSLFARLPGNDNCVIFLSLDDPAEVARLIREKFVEPTTRDEGIRS